MTKLMTTHGWAIDASALERMPNHGANSTCSAKPGDRSLGAQKYAAAGARRPSVLQVGRDRLADVLGQRQLVTLAAFAAYTEMPRAPVNVVEFEKCHFPQAQSQSRD